MPNPPPDDPGRRSPTLADLKEELERGLNWDPDLTPAFTDLPPTRITPRGQRGFLGEDDLARTAAARGEIILDGPVGPESWNQGGPDLVTLAEDDRGLVINFYDNKAYTSRKNVSTVNALGENFDASLARYKTDWTKLASDPTLSDAEQGLFARAVELADEGRYNRLVTNSYGRIEGVTDRVDLSGIGFEDTAGNLSKGPSPPLPPAFSSAAQSGAPPGPSSAAPALDDLPPAFGEAPTLANQAPPEPPAPPMKPRLGPG